MTKWQPIESAPRDGTRVLLFEPATYTNRNPARVVVASYPTHYPREATHWMPLPPLDNEHE